MRVYIYIYTWPYHLQGGPFIFDTVYCVRVAFFLGYCCCKRFEIVHCAVLSCDIVEILYQSRMRVERIFFFFLGGGGRGKSCRQFEVRFVLEILCNLMSDNIQRTGFSYRC